MRDRGSSLVEACAALTIVGLAVLTASSTLGMIPGVASRLAAQHALVRALDTTIENLRGGVHPPSDVIFSLPATASRPPVTVQVETEPAGPPGLWSVTLTAACDAHGRTVRRGLTTMVWMPE
jgi:hypothetical protein